MRYKLAFITGGTKGDVFPFIGIARELKKRGHEIVFIGSELHRPFSEAEGFDYECVISREKHESLLAHPDMWKPVKGLKLYIDHAVLATAEPTYEAIVKHAKNKNLVLVANNMCIAALLAHEKLGIPMASLFLHPYSRASAINPPKDTPLYNAIVNMAGVRGRRMIMHAVEAYLNSLFKPMNSFRAKLDLPPITDVLGAYRHSVPLIMDLWPEWYGPGMADWPKQALRTGFVAYDGPAKDTRGWQERLDVSDLLTREPIVFTMGSEMKQNFDHQLKLFSEACRLLDRPGIFVSTGFNGTADHFNVGPNFKVIRYAPFSELFPMSSVVLSHGGIGTIARIVGAGRPSMITPLAYDQFDNAYRVEQLKIGKSLPYKSPSPKKLARVLDEVITNPEFRYNAQIIAKRMMFENGTKEAADLIESRFLGISRGDPLSIAS